MTTNLIVLGENAARIHIKVNPNMTVLKASISNHTLL